MRVSYNQLTELTGMTYRTLKKRLGGMKPIGVGKNNANVWDSEVVLPVLYGVGKSDDALDGRVEKARLDKSRRIAQEIKNTEAMGESILLSDVKKDFFYIGRQCRDAILSIPGRLAPGFVVESDQHRIEMTLVDELTKALEGLSNEYTHK